MTTLTIAIFQNNELPLSYLENSLRSLKAWNADGLSDAQIVIISQLPSPDPLKALCAAAEIEAEVVSRPQEFIGGAAVWDVVADLRNAWPLFRGRFLSIQHPEFIWLPGGLRRTIDYLTASKELLLLGNLRRPVAAGQRSRGDYESCRPLVAAMQACDWVAAKQIAETLHTIHWIYWTPPPPPADTNWREDVFFVDREWCEAWQMTSHGGRLPFQDVFDLMGRATQVMPRFQVAPKIVRMPLMVNQIIHIWHPRAWTQWTLEMRDYFLKNPDWKNYEFSNAFLWTMLMELRQRNDHGNFRAVIQLRLGNRGTVTRYGNALRVWLAAGGSRKLQAFLNSRKAASAAMGV